MNIGDRVRVRIIETGEWVRGAAESMNGKTGTVKEVRASGQVLVTFDTPAEPWWAHQSPVLGFHFEENELEKLEEIK